jgi:CHAT domain-containing protein/tetratricopeptide (TPR) repeat protein
MIGTGVLGLLLLLGGAAAPHRAHDPALDSALVAAARANVDAIRDSLRRTLIKTAGDSQPAAGLAIARHLAEALAAAWNDSFPLRQVVRFEAWPIADRRIKASADSLRSAGNRALGRKGLAAALHEWRESYRRSAQIGDSAGMGAALGNIGAGFYQSDELDSADHYLTRARAIAEPIGDWRTVGNAVGTLAEIQADRGALAWAADLYMRAADFRSRTGDARGAAADRNNLGLIAGRLGDLGRARLAFDGAFASNRAAARDEPAAANLINLGNLSSLEGDYPQAVARYREALALYRAHGNRVDAASVLRALGLLALQRGNYHQALDRFTEALAVFRRTGPAADEIDVRREISLTHAAMGNLQGALIQLRRAEELAGRGHSGADQAAELAQLALVHADLAVQFNIYADAERHYVRAEQLFREAGDSRGKADAESGLGLLLALRSDFPGALTRISLALRTQESIGDPRSAALTRLLLGAIQAQMDDTTAARTSIARALSALRTLGDAAGEAAAMGALADLAVQERLPLEAESQYRIALARLDSAVAPAISWRLHSGLGSVLRGRGALDEAAAELRAASREGERMSASVRVGERRAAFSSDKGDVYAQLAYVEIARGNLDSAFEASERLRARELLDLLAQGRVTLPVSGGANGALASREQDLRRQIDVLTGELESARTVGALRGPLAPERTAVAVREALAQVQRRYGDLLLQMRESQPQYAAIVTGSVASARSVRSRLGAGEALLEYLVGDSTTLLFVVTADTTATIDLGVSRHELAKLVDFSRGMLGRPSASAPSELWRAPLRRLDTFLIEPAEKSGLLAGKQSLIIVPQAELHYVPFAALLGASGDDAFLVERYRVSYAPSASVWLRLRERPPATGTTVLALAPRVDALPASRAEVEAIGKTYGPRAQLLIGAQASERALRAAAPRASIVHFATYGVLNKDNPLFSFVELAPENGASGRLEVHDVFGLRLNARLVVLSACQTALGAGALEDVPAGDDWVGLVQAFHSAGAANVIAGLWPVDDRATAELMADFYAELSRGRPESEALALAQRKMLRNIATAHPFYWAAFTMSGGQ